MTEEASALSIYSVYLAMGLTICWPCQAAGSATRSRVRAQTVLIASGIVAEAASGAVPSGLFAGSAAGGRGSSLVSNI